MENSSIPVESSYSLCVILVFNLAFMGIYSSCFYINMTRNIFNPVVFPKWSPNLVTPYSYWRKQFISVHLFHYLYNELGYRSVSGVFIYFGMGYKQFSWSELVNNITQVSSQLFLIFRTFYILKTQKNQVFYSENPRGILSLSFSDLSHFIFAIVACASYTIFNHKLDDIKFLSYKFCHRPPHADFHIVWMRRDY